RGLVLDYCMLREDVKFGTTNMGNTRGLRTDIEICKRIFHQYLTNEETRNSTPEYRALIRAHPHYFWKRFYQAVFIPSEIIEVSGDRKGVDRERINPFFKAVAEIGRIEIADDLTQFEDKFTGIRSKPRETQSVIDQLKREGKARFSQLREADKEKIKNAILRDMRVRKNDYHAFEEAQFASVFAVNMVDSEALRLKAKEIVVASNPNQIISEALVPAFEDALYNLMEAFRYVRNGWIFGEREDLKDDKDIFKYVFNQFLAKSGGVCWYYKTRELVRKHPHYFWTVFYQAEFVPQEILVEKDGRRERRKKPMYMPVSNPVYNAVSDLAQLVIVHRFNQVRDQYFIYKGLDDEGNKILEYYHIKTGVFLSQFFEDQHVFNYLRLSKTRRITLRDKISKDNRLTENQKKEFDAACLRIPDATLKKMKMTAYEDETHVFRIKFSDGRPLALSN
ncbi:MAG: hypothetical protein ABII23_07425, partial [bacterium]